MTFQVEAIELLKQLQWHWEPHDEYYHRDQGYFCPICGGAESSGHRTGCDLGAILSKYEVAS